MNKTRRKKIEEVISKLEEIRDEIEEISRDEMGAFDALPESLQDGERGQQIYENADDIEYQSSMVDDIISELQDIIER